MRINRPVEFIFYLDVSAPPITQDSVAVIKSIEVFFLRAMTTINHHLHPAVVDKAMAGVTEGNTSLKFHLPVCINAVAFMRL
ncbi:MAG: hypothetical protein ACKPKQ_08710 [Dolichospermum sp.]